MTIDRFLRTLPRDPDTDAGGGGPAGAGDAAGGDHEAEGEVIAIALPWPDRSLHPNGRLHWRPHAAAKKAARAYARGLTLSLTTPAQRAELKASQAPLAVTMTFNPPDLRRRDDDGMISAMKAARDGIADAIGVDDHRWRVTYVVSHPVEGGRVLVEMRPAEDAWESIGSIARRMVEGRIG